MSQKPIMLIVEDDQRWLNSLEESLEVDHQIRKARTLTEVTSIIDNKDIKIEIALVDIRLNNKIDNDDSGLAVMFSLNKIGVPCIAITAYENGNAIRAALLIGRAKDIWFKNESLVILKEKVANISNRIKDEQKEAVSTINFNKEFWRFGINLLLIVLVTLGAIVGMAKLIPNNFIAVVTAAIVLIITIFITLALFYNKITGEQFTQLIKSILDKGKK